MKNIFLGIFAFLSIMACTKTAEGNTTESKTTDAELVQKPLEFKNDAGETITVTYYSEGDLVAVKITPAGKDEQKLTAKTVNQSGNPVFTNDNYMWEIVQDGHGGKLSDKNGKTTDYRLTAQAD